MSAVERLERVVPQSRMFVHGTLSVPVVATRCFIVHWVIYIFNQNFLIELFIHCHRADFGATSTPSLDPGHPAKPGHQRVNRR